MQSKEEGKDHELINQIPHLTKDTIWESDKHTKKHHNRHTNEPSGLFSIGDHKATRNRQDSIMMTEKHENVSPQEALPWNGQ